MSWLSKKLLAIVLAILGLVSANQALAAQSYNIAAYSWSYTTPGADGNNWDIYNGCSSAIFVPNNNTSEWNAFYTYKPGCVTISLSGGSTTTGGSGAN